jgi:uncharacterized membrane-anchored protein YjiN (DUF445 family)
MGMDAQQIQQMVREEVERVFNDKMIQSIVKHEVEERIARIVWDSETRVVDMLVQKIVFRNLNELLDKELPEEKARKIVQEKIKAYDIPYQVRNRLDKVLGEMPDEVFKQKVDEAVQKAVKEVAEHAKQVIERYTREEVDKIFQGRIGVGIDIIVGSIQDLRRRLDYLEQELARRNIFPPTSTHR